MEQAVLLESGSPYLTIPEAAAAAGVSAERVRRAVRRGDVPVHRTGRLRRVRLSDVQRVLAAEGG